MAYFTRRLAHRFSGDVRKSARDDQVFGLNISLSKDMTKSI
ncbi:19745_t:CDS:2 [Rhizophagus irregularis]|nr:19745_t:CDS:2 [Rhizophagus irregularis]